MKKVAIVCTVVALLLMGTSAGVFASGIMSASSQGNYFEAKVATNSDALLLSDWNENEQEVIYDSLSAQDVSVDYVDTGFVQVLNDSAYPVLVRPKYDGPGCGADIAQDCEWVLKVSIAERNGEILYEGPMDYFGTGDMGFVLDSFEEVTLNFEVKTAWELTEDDMTSVNFNVLFEAQPAIVVTQ
jgi:hypothetical protein